MASTTLYYPYIHPRNIDHLKAALIYWDRVRRIVPKTIAIGKHATDDSGDCEFLAEQDLLVSTSPENYEAAAAQRFFSHLEPRATQFRIDIDAARDLADRNHGIHVEKIGESALRKLRELGLAKKFGDWVMMHDKVGAFYMFCMATEIANAMNVSLMTDSPVDAELGQALLFESESKKHSSEMLLRLGISLPSAEQLSQVPLKKIVAFADKRAAEKLAFRETVEGILEAARSHKEPDAMDDFLAGERKKLEKAVRDLRSTLDELKLVGTASAAAKLTVPAGLATFMSSMSFSPTATAILGTCGLTLAAVSCFAETRGKIRQAKNASPYHYLVGIHRKLGIKRAT